MQKQSSRYIDIAIQVATLIVNGELSEGDKVSGRSTLASKYNVSPETVRRAVALLKDFGVVDSEPKNGITIVSPKKAHEFVMAYHKKSSIMHVRKELLAMMQLRKEQDALLVEKVNQMIEELSTSQHGQKAITPMETIVPQTSGLVGKSLLQCDFWHHTSATIIAVRRQDTTHLSPNPAWVIEPLDVLVFVGKKESYRKMNNYISR